MNTFTKNLMLLMLGCLMAFQVSAQEQEYYSIAKKGGKFGLISSNGQVILKPQFEELGTFSEGLICFRKGELWGAIDKSGTEVIAPKFVAPFVFHNGMAVTSIPNKPGYDVIDNTGKVKFHQNLVLFDFKGFTNGLEPVLDMKKSKVGLINKLNALVLEPNYDEIKSFSNDRWLVRKGLMFGFLDKAGKLVIKPIYEDATPFKNGVAIVKALTKSSLIGTDGKVIVNPGVYQKIVSVNGDQYLRVTKQKMVGLIDVTGKVIIPPTYQSIKEFQNGLAVIQLDGKYGAIDTVGNVVIKPTFQNMEDFKEEVAEISLNDKFGFADKTGKIIVKPTYEELQAFNSGVAIFKKNEKYGLIDKTGKTIAAAKYTEIIPLTSGYHRVQNGTTYGIIDRNDKTIVPLEYEEIGALEEQK